MKYKYLALILALASFSLSVINGVAHAETPAATASVAPPAADEFEMFRFSLQMDRQDFVKKGMGLNEEQEKKFLSVYYEYNVELKMLNEKRLAIIVDYANNFDHITNVKADELVKRMFEFRKQRSALLVKYYGKVSKATTKIIAARFLQVESVLQGASDVIIGSKIPLMSK